MNTQNIALMTEILAAAGFDLSIRQRIVRQVCFKPKDFCLTERVVRNDGILTCSIFFERKGEEYICSHYDASFFKAIDMPDLVIQSINLKDLDSRMADVDWTNDHFNEIQGLDPEYRNELKIETVVSDLFRLSTVEEGRYYADSLKVKYWSDIPVINGSLNAVRIKFEVSQRFYFFDGQGISIDEAYRFLLNRWLEKKLNARKKANAGDSGPEATEPSTKSKGKGLLKKKRHNNGNRLTP